MGTEWEVSIASQLPCTFFVQQPSGSPPLPPSSDSLRHCPFTRCLSLNCSSGTLVVTWHWLSCFLRSIPNRGRKPKWYLHLSVCVPTTPACWTQPLEMEQWWSAAKLGMGRGAVEGRSGRKGLSDQAFQTWLHSLPFWLWQVSLPPKPQLPHKENGTAAPTLKTDCEN